MSTPTLDADAVAVAVADAADAADLADLAVVDDHGPQACVEVSHLLDRVWGREGGAILAPEVIRALGHAGNQVTLARRDGALVAATVAFLGRDAGGTFLHSHITGVAPGLQSRGVGLAMKLHQRAWALARGIDRIVWTFDPLVRRNAWFNLGRLGAHATGYIRDMYGRMPDAINRGLPTDRLVVAWDARAPLPRAAVRDGAAGAPAGAAVLLAVGADDRPVVGTARRGGACAAAVPADIEALRRDRPDVAAAWHDAIRATLGARMEGGDVVARFDRGGWYLLQPAGGTGGHDEDD